MNKPAIIGHLNGWTVDASWITKYTRSQGVDIPHIKTRESPSRSWLPRPAVSIPTGYLWEGGPQALACSNSRNRQSLAEHTAVWRVSTIKTQTIRPCLCVQNNWAHVFPRGIKCKLRRWAGRFGWCGRDGGHVISMLQKRHWDYVMVWEVQDVGGHRPRQ